jgi:hypothetical protein
MTDKQPCKRCDVLILPTTALNNDGMCIPCKKGRRGDLERSRRKQEEMRSRPPDPMDVYWTDLVKRVHSTPDGFDRLPHDEQLYFATGELASEAWRGGLHTYFFNSAGNHYVQAREGLLALGATRCLSLLDEAAALLFPESGPPADWGLRRERLPWWRDDEASDAAWAVPIARIDEAFHPLGDALGFRLCEFAVERQLVQVPEGYMDRFRAMTKRWPKHL